MMETITKVDEIIDNINNEEAIKRLEELKIIMDNDKNIQDLLTTFNIYKAKYEVDNLVTKELTESKKNLYENEVVYEYNKIYSNLNFALASFNRKILTLLDNSLCSKK